MPAPLLFGQASCPASDAGRHSIALWSEGCHKAVSPADAMSCRLSRFRNTDRKQPWVARGGVEPPTFHFSGERCYQLSYLAIASTAEASPAWCEAKSGGIQALDADLATPTGLEPATSAVTGRRANQLRHGARFATRKTLADLPDCEKSDASSIKSPDRTQQAR